MIKKLGVFLLLISMIFILGLFTSCSDDDDKETVEIHDTTYIEISMITPQGLSYPDNITQGETIELFADFDKAPEVGELTYHWFAEGGEIFQHRTDTVSWKAPDTEGTYKVTVHATDGTYIGIGSANIGVGMYAPTVNPYYVGDESCSTCHSTTHAGWETTGHAEAWAGLMTSGHVASYCYPCHAVMDDVSGNSGYDDAAIAMFEDVQCESCHGPGSEHISAPGSNDMTVDYTSLSCGTCHEGEHHPYLTEWTESPHNFDETSSHGAPANASCQGCHEGGAALTRLSGDLSAFYGSGAVANDIEEILPVTCQVCHVSHSAENMGQLRTVADVQLTEANGETPVITDGGTGKLCMQCHHARRGGESQIANGYAHFGPHSSPQADMVAAKSAYHGVADPGFTWSGQFHLNVQNSCKTCHLDMAEYSASVGYAVTGHTFEPTTNSCVPCHGEITAFNEIMAHNDFDGDGTVEGIQDEVGGLVTMLTETLEADIDPDSLALYGLEGCLGDTAISTEAMRKAGYNLVFVESDGSHGIHNPGYTIQLLQTSYEFYTGRKLPEAVRFTSNNSADAVKF